jgi:uncharacterized lipoprotein
VNKNDFLLVWPKRVLLTALSILFLASCSWSKRGEDVPVYYGSVEIEPLDVPADLDQPQLVNPLVIPKREVNLPSADEIETTPPRVASTGGQSDVNAWISWSADGVYLKVRDNSTNVANRLGPAIEKSGMTLLDSKVTGSYRFEYTHVPMQETGFFKRMKFWGDDAPDFSGLYQTEVRADGGNSRVYLLQGDGEPAPNSAAEHILAVFMEQFG